MSGKGWQTKTVSEYWMSGCDCNNQKTIPCIVLDPFIGSGTTGLVALKRGRSFIGIELNPVYIEEAKKRLIPWLSQTRLPIEVTA